MDRSFHPGLHRNRATAQHWQCQPGSVTLVRPWGSWLWHKLPAAVAGLRHQPLRAARRGDVWLHEHVRLRERCLDQGETWTSAAGQPSGRQSAWGTSVCCHIWISSFCPHCGWRQNVLCPQPFWPMGTGCARGFLAAFDTAWMVRGWAQGRNPLETLAERCVYCPLFVTRSSYLSLSMMSSQTSSGSM